MCLTFRLFLAFLFGVPLLGAADARPQETVGTLDFFGLRRLSEAEVRAALALQEGERFDRGAVKTLVDRLQKLPGVTKATVAPITVDGTGKLKVFVGIQEEGAAGVVLRESPKGDERLPEPLMAIHRDFSTALGPSVRKGGDREDSSQGHALNQHAELRRPQEAAIAQLRSDVTLVREVLRSSGDVAHRRAAAWLLGYAPDKKAIVADMVEAARDPDAGVRNNATRALGAIAKLADAQPELGIVIPPEVFLDLIRSVTWTDRNKGSFLLYELTKSRPPALLRTLRERALPELIEMARWKSDGHAFPAVRILGRIAGWDDEQTLRTWREGGIEKIIAAAEAGR